MKKLPILILFTLLAFVPIAWAQNSLTLNDGTDINTRLPITGHNVDRYSKSQSIIPASELASMKWGTITKLTFYSENAPESFGSAQFKVYLAEVDYTKFDSVYYNGSNLVSASSQDWSTLTKVYEGGVSVSENKMEITLTTPFEYGVGNLLIGFYMSQPGTYASTRWLGVNQNTNTSVYELIPSFYQEGEFLPKVTISYTPTNEPCLRPILAFDNATPYEATVRWTEDDNTALAGLLGWRRG